MQAPQYESSSIYAFSPRELERLAIYRAAIDAGFYTDRCEPLSIAPEPNESSWHLPALSVRRAA